MEGRGPKKKYFMKFYEFYELMIFFYELMNWWKNGEVLIIDNHCAPSHSEGVWKNQNWSIIKADNEYKETQSKQLFPPSGEAVLSPRHDLWAMFYDHARLLCTNSGARTFIGWKKLGHNLARILLECTLHTFANCICICTHLQIVFAFCLSISFAPMTHFLLKFANQKL